MRAPFLFLCLLAVPFGSLPAHAADQPPIEVASPHFTLITAAGEKQGRHLLDNFERMRWMFQTLFPKAKVDPDVPVIIIALRNKKEFQAFEPKEYMAKGQLNLAGYFLNTNERNYVLLRLDAESENHPFATVYHEYTHLQFRDAGDSIPLWLNEGIAEFFQNTDFHDKQVLLGEPSADDILYLRQASLIPLATLFRVDHNSPYYHEEEKGSVFYSESWALTHYLEVTGHQSGKDRIGDYMRRVGQHEDPVVAAQEAFGDLKELEKQLAYYIRGAQYKEFILNSAAAPIDSASYKVRTLTQPEFDARRADVLAYAGRGDDARALATSIMAADPKLPEPHETMGYLALTAGDQEAARKWYAEAIQLHSQDFLAYYQFATLSMSSSDTSAGQQVEDSLRTCIQLNPRFALAYDELASWYAGKRDRLDEAQALNQQAVQLDRTNLYFRLNAANLYMMRDQLDRADQTLQFARTLAKTPDQAAMVEDRMKIIASVRKARAAGATLVPQPGLVTFTETSSIKVSPVENPPKHPVEPAKGPRHTVLGSIRNVHCDSPSYLELQVQIAGKPTAVSVYSSDYFNLDLSALGFEPKKEMNPCRDLNGFNAKVVYAESSDKTIDGQIVSVELHK